MEIRKKGNTELRTGGSIVSFSPVYLFPKIYIWVLLPLVAGFLAGCEKIEGDHFEHNATVDSSYVFPADTDSTSAVFKVMLEDYTGHYCGYCPDAATLLYTTIKPAYSDRLITMSVHAGSDAKPAPPLPNQDAPAGSFTEDLRTPAGTAWYTTFGINFYPCGEINRKPVAGYASGSWNSQVANILNTPAKVKIRLHTTYNVSTRELKAFAEVRFLAAMNGNYKLNIVITEDSVLAWQIDYNLMDINVQNYVNRHVMRGSLNGNWGEQLTTSGVIPAGSVFNKGYVQTLPANYRSNQVNIVAFVYDATTYEILNVEETAIDE
jgi:hypothetical protein